MLRYTFLQAILHLSLSVQGGPADEGKKCFSPVVCSYSDSSSKEWLQVFPPHKCEFSSINMSSAILGKQGERGIQCPPGKTGNRGPPGANGVMNTSMTTYLKTELMQKTFDIMKLNDIVNSTMENYDAELMQKTFDIMKLNETMNSIMESYEAELMQKTFDIIKLNETMNSMNSTMENYETELMQKALHIMKLNETMKSTLKNNEAVTRLLKNENSQLNETVKRLNDKISPYEKEVATLRRGNENLNGMLNEMKKTVEQLKLDVKAVVDRRKQVRLVDGSSSAEGRIEIFHNNIWGTICDDYWDKEHGNVVCKMLGFERATWVSRDPDGTSTDRTGKFGQGSGTIWLDDLKCKGTEHNLFQCPKVDWGKNNCGHHEDASVVCSKGENEK